MFVFLTTCCLPIVLTVPQAPAKHLMPPPPPLLPQPQRLIHAKAPKPVPIPIPLHSHDASPQDPGFMTRIARWFGFGDSPAQQQLTPSQAKQDQFHASSNNKVNYLYQKPNFQPNAPTHNGHQTNQKVFHQQTVGNNNKEPCTNMCNQQPWVPMFAGNPSYAVKDHKPWPPQIEGQASHLVLQQQQPSNIVIEPQKLQTLKQRAVKFNFPSMNHLKDFPKGSVLVPLKAGRLPPGVPKPNIFLPIPLPNLSPEALPPLYKAQPFRPPTPATVAPFSQQQLPTTEPAHFIENIGAHSELKPSQVIVNSPQPPTQGYQGGSSFEIVKSQQITDFVQSIEYPATFVQSPAFDISYKTQPQNAPEPTKIPVASEKNRSDLFDAKFSKRIPASQLLTDLNTFVAPTVAPEISTTSALPLLEVNTQSPSESETPYPFIPQGNGFLDTVLADNSPEASSLNVSEVQDSWNTIPNEWYYSTPQNYLDYETSTVTTPQYENDFNTERNQQQFYQEQHVNYQQQFNNQGQQNYQQQNYQQQNFDQVNQSQHDHLRQQNYQQHHQQQYHTQQHQDQEQQNYKPQNSAQQNYQHQNGEQLNHQQQNYVQGNQQQNYNVEYQQQQNYKEQSSQQLNEQQQNSQQQIYTQQNEEQVKNQQHNYQQQNYNQQNLQQQNYKEQNYHEQSNYVHENYQTTILPQDDQQLQNYQQQNYQQPNSPHQNSQQQHSQQQNYQQQIYQTTILPQHNHQQEILQEQYPVQHLEQLQNYQQQNDKQENYHQQNHDIQNHSQHEQGNYQQQNYNQENYQHQNYNADKQQQDYSQNIEGPQFHDNLQHQHQQEQNDSQNPHPNHHPNHQDSYQNEEAGEFAYSKKNDRETPKRFLDAPIQHYNSHGGPPRPFTKDPSDLHLRPDIHGNFGLRETPKRKTSKAQEIFVTLPATTETSKYVSTPTPTPTSTYGALDASGHFAGMAPPPIPFLPPASPFMPMKQVNQIVIPYTTKNRPRPFEPTKTIERTTVPSYPRNGERWPHPNEIDPHQAESKLVAATTEVPPTNTRRTTKYLTKILASNLRELLKKEHEIKNKTQSPGFDLMKLQRNIDVWTEQEYTSPSHRASTPTIRGRSKHIPAEYLTTTTPTPPSQPPRTTSIFENEGLTSSINNLEPIFGERNSKRFEFVPIDDNSLHELYDLALAQRAPTKDSKLYYRTSTSSTTSTTPSTSSPVPTVLYTTTTRRPLELSSETTEESETLWQKAKVTISPDTKEKLYVVTPQPKYFPQRFWTPTTEAPAPTENKGIKTPRFLVRPTPRNGTSTTRDTSSFFPNDIFGLMNLSSYVPDQPVEIIDGNSKVNYFKAKLTQQD